MEQVVMDRETKDKIKVFQRNEITEHIVYRWLSRMAKDPTTKDVLERLSGEELGHYRIWRTYTGEDIGPDRVKVWVYYLICRILGLTFGLKLMERGEEDARLIYRDVSKFIPKAQEIAEDEDEHERQLVNLIDEERLRYVGSMVLGLNDALVELTGALAGLTLALQNTRLIAMAGLITGIAASLSMAASEYLSTKSEEADRDPLKASLYTGCAYILTVVFLIFPFLFLANYYCALCWTLLNAIIVIIIFTYYVSVAKEISFKNRFFEMASISMGIAALSFGLGFLVRAMFGIDI